MYPPATHIAHLLYREQAGTLDSAGQQELDEWLRAHPRQAARLAGVREEEDLVFLLDARSPERIAALKDELYHSIAEQIGWQRERVVHRVHFLRTAWFKYAAAIILLFGIGAYLWNNYNTKPIPDTATIEPSSSDILPGGQKAKLTLADGREIILDNAKNGQLASEHGSDIIKRGGEIIYDAGQHRDEAVVYNTMSTPKGGQYQLTLPDGTKVWLNAASQITYPTRFIGNTREVKVEGEVYFDIKPNKNQPFIVKTSSDEIKVLGTEFNVNNYRDEPQSKISLINGSVKVNDQLLQPGQAFSNGKIMQTNIEQDVAWRKGAFSFNATELSTVLRQLARWYDIEIVYPQGPVTRKITGSMGRDLTLQETLEGLNSMGVRGTIKGRQLIITK